MKNQISRIISLGVAVLGGLVAVECLADQIVTVNAAASPGYTQHKFGAGKTTPETYVVKAGQFVAGEMANDSLNGTPFRRVVEALAPELARRQYLPARNPKDADLLIVMNWGSGAVHWPLQAPAFFREPVNPDNKSQLLMDRANLPSDLPAPAPIAMPKSYPDYFVTLAAYDLHAPAAERNREIWTIDLSIPSPGNAYSTALKCMSAAAADYVGRSTAEPQHVRPQPPKDLAATDRVLILDEEKPGAAAEPAGT